MDEPFFDVQSGAGASREAEAFMAVMKDRIRIWLANVVEKAGGEFDGSLSQEQLLTLIAIIQTASMLQQTWPNIVHG